jgi:hypothetical protein
MEQQTDFFKKLDGMILAGTPVIQISRSLNIRERTIRRRKAELGRQGHTFSKLQGTLPGAEHVRTA